MSRKWNRTWEKVLSVLLTANIAVMGWLWASVARLAERLDRHCADRAIHQEIDVAELVGRREFEVSRESGRESDDALVERVGKLEEKVDRVAMGRVRNGS